MGSPTSAVSWIGIVQLRQCKMSRLLSTSFIVLVALSLTLLVISASADPHPGHMQHQYYKEQQRQHSSILSACWPLPCWGAAGTTALTWYERDGVVRTMMCSSVAPRDTYLVFSLFNIDMVIFI